jgi:hypothetical protein
VSRALFLPRSRGMCVVGSAVQEKVEINKPGLSYKGLY